ncbi:MAG: iron ABC transporter permease [Clostridia bacterium]|nr:MAG: iron ABC transporter permease [Clostridia bacterium]
MFTLKHRTDPWNQGRDCTGRARRFLALRPSPVPRPRDRRGTVEEIYASTTFRKALLLVGLVILLAAAGLVAATAGAAQVGAGDVWRVVAGKFLPAYRGTAGELARTVVVDLRLPRILLAVITGMSLAGAGAAMQGVLHNPLVDPYILGLSSGAAFGAALAIVLGAGFLAPVYGSVGPYLVITNAFVFGILAMWLVYGIARLRGTAPETLILGGVAIGYLFSAGVALLKYVSENEALKELVVWLMGGLWGATWEAVRLLFPLVLASQAVLLYYAWDVNALLAGEEVAGSLGVNVRRVRLLYLGAASMAAAATVAFTGIIGFVGLVAPHICRLLIGNDYRFLIPCSSLLGAALLLVADTGARTIMAPTEIPVGVITSLIGVPFFLGLLLKRRSQISL